ncbi:MAG: hypothetical protein WCQ90_13130 [Deltaproteobacteria bacterium]
MTQGTLPDKKGHEWTEVCFVPAFFPNGNAYVNKAASVNIPLTIRIKNV